jgi:serine/threonine protein kinase
MSDKGTILIVDDSEPHRAVIARELEKVGYNTATADSGAKAIQTVTQDAIDLVLLDVVMPGLDGFTTLRQLRRNNTTQSLPIIMLTARDDAEDVIQALRLGANDYAVKPIRLSELMGRIETHLKLKRGKDETLGHYRLLGKLGEGAMGIVYEAEEINGEGRAALKVLPRSLTLKKQAVQRFLQEGSLISKANHKNVVKLFDIGRDGETYYIAMELVIGETLDKLARRKPMEPQHCLKVSRQVALGLEHLFEKGVIHRDIKPQNIMINANGDVKIADFGIARDTSRDHRLTQEGTGLGSLVYSAPEQIGGKAQHHADMYSLGCTMFEMLAGQAPFPRDKNIEWMIEAKYKKVPKLNAVRGDAPKDIAALIYRLMQPKPAKRFESYQDLIAAIDALIVVEE